MIEPWPSTRRRSPPRSLPSTTSRSAAPAMKSATTASTESPQPAIAIPVWPVGTNLEAIPRARASRSSSSETVIFPIAQSEPTVRTILPGTSRFAPLGTSRSSGGRRRSVSVAPDSRASGASSGSSRRNWCRPFSIPIPFVTQSRRISRQAGGNRPPCVATPTSAAVGASGRAAATSATIGTPSSFSPARVESRIATTSSRR